MGRRRIRRIHVVVPAYNEAAVLPNCLHSIRCAAAAVDVPVTIGLVLDGCTDSSDASSALADAVVLVDARNVGVARAAGFAAVEQLDAAWLVTTDADCVVDTTWLQRHLAHARSGADAVCGTVEVGDWSGFDHGVRARYEAHYDSRDGHRHVHGANLGFTSDAYSSVGGFHALALGEDVDLVTRLDRAGYDVRRVGDVPVRTSSRLDSRVRGGFGDYLRDLAEQGQQ